MALTIFVVAYYCSFKHSAHACVKIALPDSQTTVSGRQEGYQTARNVSESAPEESLEGQLMRFCESGRLQPDGLMLGCGSRRQLIL